MISNLSTVANSTTIEVEAVSSKNIYIRSLENLLKINDNYFGKYKKLLKIN